MEFRDRNPIISGGVETKLTEEMDPLLTCRKYCRYTAAREGKRRWRRDESGSPSERQRNIVTLVASLHSLYSTWNPYHYDTKHLMSYCIAHLSCGIVPQMISRRI